MEPVTTCEGDMEPVTTCEGDMETVTTCDSEFVIPPTPSCVGEFNREWIKYVMDGWFVKNSIRPQSVDILSFYAALNSVQVMKLLGQLNLVLPVFTMI